MSELAPVKRGSPDVTIKQHTPNNSNATKVAIKQHTPNNSNAVKPIIKQHTPNNSNAIKIIRHTPNKDDSTPTTAVYAQPSATLDLKHPKTGTPVSEAVKKVVDTRSPQVSPVARILPREKFEDIVTTPYSSKSGSTRKSVKGPGVTPRKRDPYYSGKREALYTSIRSYETYDTDTPIEVVVDENEDGTFTPLRVQSVYKDEAVVPRSKYDNMTEEEQFKMRFNMEAEINRIVAKNPELGLLPVATGDLPMPELDGYLAHVNDQVGHSEQYMWFDIALEGGYSLVAYAMERMGVPMKAYFDKLKSRIVDYRELLMKDPSARDAIEKIMPMMTSSAGKSKWVIIGVMVGQVAIGCLAALVNSWGGKGMEMAGNGGAHFVSNQLDSYMFKDQSIWGVLKNVGQFAFSKDPPARPVGVKADV